MMLPTTTVGAPTSLGKWYCVGRRTAADRRRHSRAVGPYTWGPAGYPSLARVGQVHAVFMVSRNIDARLDFQRKSLVSLYADFSAIIRMMSSTSERIQPTLAPVFDIVFIDKACLRNSRSTQFRPQPWLDRNIFASIEQSIQRNLPTHWHNMVSRLFSPAQCWPRNHAHVSCITFDASIVACLLCVASTRIPGCRQFDRITDCIWILITIRAQ